MIYSETIKKILADEQWHCILDLISETGLSARNRISEMNQDYNIGMEERINKYIGEVCKLEKCFHKASLYMYKLNPLYINEDKEKLFIVDQKLEEEYKEQDEELEEWNSLSREDRKERISIMMNEKGM